ncbi:MAG: AAA family ATPase [Gammaproteobacteria bacterium]|nr:AAA family ATPase [Gammaproteobacteria bacterium]
MISSLKISSFKSILDADIEFGNVNVFIGSNGSGKSNVLEAIGLFSACLERGVDAQTLDYKGIRLSAPHIFKSSFKNRRLPRAIRLEGTVADLEYKASLQAGEHSSHLQFFTESMTAGGRPVFSRAPRGFRLGDKSMARSTADALYLDPHRSLWDTHGANLDTIGKSARMALREISRYAIYTPQTAVMRGIVPDHRATEPLGLTGSRLPQAFRELLRQYRKSKGKGADVQRQREIGEALKMIWAPGWASKVKVGPPDIDTVPEHLPASKETIHIVDKFLTVKRNTLSPYDASEGTLYLIFMAVLLAHSEAPAVFALDNVDGTLNPRMVRFLVEHIVDAVDGNISEDGENTHPKQVFLTSHNPTALDAIDLFDPGKRLFVVSRNQQGHTIFDRIRPPENMTKERWIEAMRGRNLSQLWLDGKIRKALG